jgi:tetratricopeptide (TPR) repeat protein
MATVVDTSTLKTPVVDVPTEVVKTVADLYHRSLYVQAYRAAMAHSPLRSWHNTAARLIAGRLAMNIGSSRLGSIMHVYAWRQDRADPEARYYYARRLAEFRGPFAAWLFMRESGELPEAPAQIRADWYAFHAYVIGRLRDFDAAEEWMNRAEQLAPTDAWVACERSYLFEMEDRYADALTASRRALSERQWFRPGIQQTAHLLQLMDRDGEALELLTQAMEHTESSSIAGQLAALQTELHLYKEARESYQRCHDLSPLAEEGAQIGMDMMRSDAAYYCGDFAAAAVHAQAASKSIFYKKFAERLNALPSSQPSDSQPPMQAAEPRRVVLEVPFVRQHHMTCAPATLSALSRYWEHPHDHLELAEQICYDGTPAHSERNWAIKSGWIVREFTMTWENARALIDRKIPFTLTTIEPTSGHLQAVIGYDELRGTLLVRDPYDRHFREFIIESTLERYRATGPRGMALIPQEKASLLDGIELNDTALYDELFNLNTALQRHDRPSAWQAYVAMEAGDNAHRLTILARRTLAGYDSDYTTLLSCAEAALKLFPGDAGLMLQKLSCLRYLARRDQRLDLLRNLCHIKRTSANNEGASPSPNSSAAAENAEAARFDPVFWLYYAQELSADARNDTETLHYIRKCIRFRPFDGAHYNVLANLLWGARKFEHATESYRIASCLAGSDERYIRSYFIASQHLKTQSAALQFIEQRFQRHGKISSAPARTLYFTLEALDRQSDALALLEKAIALRPEDGEFLLFAANAFEAYGRHERAAELVAAAEKRSHRTQWLRVSATMARNRGNLQDARKYWEEIVALEPLAFDAQRAFAQLIAELEGRPAAQEYLKKCCERFPYNFLIHQLRTEWLRDDDPAIAEGVLRHLMELDADDAWTHRELAGSLTRQRKFEEGLREADTALQLDPSNTFGHCVRARLLLGMQQRDQARESYRNAIRLAVDSHFAIRELLACCETAEQKRGELAFIHEQIVHQVNFGDGLLAYRTAASESMDADSLLKALREAQSARPDLWHAWSALIQQLTEMDRLDEAMQLAKEATERFPLIGHLWHDLATVHRAKNDTDGRIAALQTACAVDPSNGFPVRELADAHASRGDFPKARGLLEIAISRAPLDNYSHGCLADIEWRLGEKETALKRLQHALKLNPGYTWAWNTLREWSADLKKSDLAAELARELTVQRPADSKAWMTLARSLDGPARREERLAAVEKAIALDGYHSEGHDLRATTLYYLKRIPEAREACRPAVFGTKVPTSLLGRAAWIEAECGDKRKAITLVREALAADPLYIWGWTRLADWCETVEDYTQYLEAAERLVQLAPQDAVPYGYRANARILASKDREGAKADYRKSLELQADYRYGALGLFDLYYEDGDFAAAQQVIDRVDAKLPNDGYILTRQVQLRARMKEADAAKAYFEKLARVDNDDSWPLDNAYTALERAGLKADAARILNECVEKSPDNFRTWQKLAELSQDSNTNLYAKAAAEMVRIRPDYPTGYGFLGNAKRLTGKQSEAVELFKKALSIAPDYRYASRSLFDLQLIAGNLAEAESTFEILGKSGKDEHYHLRGVRLGLQKKNTNEALDHFHQLCQMTQVPKERLESSMDAFRKANQSGAAHKALGEWMERSPINHHVAELWIESQPKGVAYFRNRRILTRLENFSGDANAKRALAIAYLELLKAQKSTGPLRDYVMKNRNLLSENTATWGSVGHILSSARLDALCLDWYAKWETRADVRPWMLLNLIISMLRSRKYDEAANVGNAALKLSTDHSIGMLSLWLAADALRHSDYMKMRTLLAGVSRPTLSNYYKFLFDLLALVLQLYDVAVPERAGGHSRMMDRLAKLRATHFGQNVRVGWGDPLLRNIYGTAVTCMGELGGTFWSRTRARFHRFFTST